MIIIKPKEVSPAKYELSGCNSFAKLGEASKSLLIQKPLQAMKEGQKLLALI